MHSRIFSNVLNVVLLATAVLVIGTGFVVDQLDLNDFLPHRWAGYAFAVLAAVHVAGRWRALVPLRRDDRRYGSAPPIPATGSVAPVGPAGGTKTPGSQAAGDNPPPGGRVTPARRSFSRRAALTTTVSTGVTGAALGWFVTSRLSAERYEGGDVGAFYHQRSSLGVGRLWRDVVNWGSRPAPYLRVGDTPVVRLPSPGRRPDMSLAQAIAQRRSLRAYEPRALTSEELAWVLSAATGITGGGELRAAPSAGALYPIETYLAVDRVERIDPGLYHLDVRAQALEPMRAGSLAGDLMIAGLGQDFLRKAPVVVVLTGLFQRTRWKYRERHYRYVCWEGGHVAQNLCLAAEAAGLGACVVGAFLDDRVNDLLRIDGREEAALGLIAVGPR